MVKQSKTLVNIKKLPSREIWAGEFWFIFEVMHVPKNKEPVWSYLWYGNDEMVENQESRRSHFGYIITAIGLWRAAAVSRSWRNQKFFESVHLTQEEKNNRQSGVFLQWIRPAGHLHPTRLGTGRRFAGLVPMPDLYDANSRNSLPNCPIKFIPYFSKLIYLTYSQY